MRKQFYLATSCGRWLIARLAAVTALFGSIVAAYAQTNDAGDPAYLRDTDAFTAHVAELYQRAMPRMTIKIAGPLTLTISGCPHPTQANLDSAYSFCLRNPRDCEQVLTSYVAKMAAAFSQFDRPVTRERLRAIVRPSAYVEAAEKMFSGKGDPIAEPLVGDLWVMCAVDAPTAIEIMKPSDLKKLNLSQDEALTLCKKNAAAALPPLAPSKRDYPTPGVNIVTGDPYASNWLIFPERWVQIARDHHGDLLVAAPGPDAVIYTSGKREVSLDSFAEAAAFISLRAEKQLSTEVFRWSATGWRETPLRVRRASQ
jgi:hypothetical protein